MENAAVGAGEEPVKECEKVVEPGVSMDNANLSCADDTLMYGGPFTHQAIRNVDAFEQSVKKGKQIAGEEAPSFSLGMTQETEPADKESGSPNYAGPFTQQVILMADECEKTIENKKKTTSNEIASFSLGLTQEFEMIETDNVIHDERQRERFVTPVPIRTYNPLSNVGCSNDRRIDVGRGKREISKSIVARSPFVQRVVDIGEKLSMDEQKSWKYVDVYDMDQGEILFKSYCGQRLVRMDLSRLLQKSCSSSILSAWSVVLNHLEIFRSPNSPSRLFLPTFDVKLSNFMEQEVDDRFQEMTNFIDNFNEYSKDRVEKSDLVFLPVDNCGKEFVLCFDMRTGGVRLFEFKKTTGMSGKGNRANKGNTFNIVIADMIKNAFGRYVATVHHAKANVIMGAYLFAGSFKWQGERYRKVSGLCMMRMMETYSGEDLQRWDCGLDGDNGKLEKQLGILAKKYVAKIMLSESNIIMATVRRKLAQFKI